MKPWTALTCISIWGICLTANAAIITYDDGGTHILSTSTTDWFDVFDGPGSQPTTVEIANGANVTGQFQAFEHSIVRVTGGLKTTQNLNLYEYSTGEISGGLVQGILMLNSATLVITGGGVNQLSTQENSSVEIYKTNFTTGLYAGIYVAGNSAVSIYGSSFVMTDIVDNVSPASWDQHSLTGRFEDGSEFATTIWYLKADPGTVSLVNVPEPASMVLGVGAAAALLAVAICRGSARGSFS